MKTPQNIKSSFDDDISVVDIINFFMSHKKIIFICVLLGIVLGRFFANFAEPAYKGSVLISPAKIAENYVVNPKVTVTIFNMNGLQKKENFLNCNLNLNNDKDKASYYDIASIVKASVTKDFELIELRMQNKNKTVVKECLNSLTDEILSSQNKIIDSFIQLKNNELRLAEEKLKRAEDFKVKLNDKQIKELKTSNETFSVDLLYTNMILFNIKDIKETLDEINKIKSDLSLEKIKPAKKVSPINFEKKLYLTPKLGSLLGLFLGLFLGILIALMKQSKI